MMMPGRKYQAGSGYRYGFNGKENDNAIGTDKYDYGARIYDSRINRWLSTDIIMNSFGSPYNFAANNPINYLDPNGEDIIHFYVIYSVTLVDGKSYFSKTTKFSLVEKNNEPNVFIHHSINVRYNGVGSTAKMSSTVVNTQFYPDVPGESQGLSLSTYLGGAIKIKDSDRKTLIKFVDDYDLTKADVDAVGGANGYTEVGPSGTFESDRMKKSRWWIGLFAEKKFDEDQNAIDQYKLDFAKAIVGGALADLVIGELFASSIWRLSVRERGLLIEAKAGGNLPTNFPVIDKEIGDVITSIKSVDLTATTYQSASKLRALARGFVKDLNDFKGATYSGKTVVTTSNTTKKIELFYQTGKASSAQLEVLERVQAEAMKKGIEIIIKAIK